MLVNHSDGYVSSIEENLIPGISKDMFFNELNNGKGKELESKFLSIASSAALAVNNFALIRKYKEHFIFEHMTNFTEAGFEKEFSTDLRGIKPQLDFYLENENTVIGFESKFLEYFQETTVTFSESYNNLAYLDKIWFELIEKYNGKKMTLDVAQLMKHAFGIINQSLKLNKKGILVFIYWLPLNYKDIETCRALLEQIDELSCNFKKQKQIEFKTISYLDFWDTYRNDLYLGKHVQNMISRYGEICV